MSTQIAYPDLGFLPQDQRLPQKVYLDTGTSMESRTILMACMLKGIEVVRVSINDLGLHKQALSQPSVLAVGSVEYMREVMAVAGIQEPPNLSYHPEVLTHLGREIRTTTASEVLINATGPLARPIFVKPVGTKQFNGFVFDPKASDTSRSEHDLEQLQALRNLDPSTPVWTSEVIKIIAEYRCYFTLAGVFGPVRYDDGAKKVDMDPYIEYIFLVAKDLWQSLRHPFALDMAVLPGDDIVVMEVNDAWAIGLYKHDDGSEVMSPIEYLKMLYERWRAFKRV